jgi:hypothetical protein
MVSGFIQFVNALHDLFCILPEEIPPAFIQQEALLHYIPDTGKRMTPVFAPT